MPEGISEEKRQWMESVGIREFPRPMKYYIPTSSTGLRIEHVYSENYIKGTPLEELQMRHMKHNQTIQRLDPLNNEA